MNQNKSAETPGIAGAIAEIEKRNGVGKHTPGPWKHHAKLSTSENHGGFCITGYKGITIGVLHPLDQDGTEGEANARLIAAAPELFEADLGAVAALSQTKTFPADIEAAKSFLNAAIGKAEDRQ